jgi:hypothetical protein
MKNDVYRQIKTLNIKTLEDLQQLAVDIMQEGADGGGFMFENTGKFYSMMQIWAKCHEMEKEEEDILHRIEVLEQKDREREISIMG